MAVVTKKSLSITNRDSTPSKASDSNIVKGEVKQFIGVVAGANGDSIASKLLFGSIPSNARVGSLKLFCSAIAVSGAADFGLYRNTADGGAVVDADFFIAAQVLTAALNGTEIAHGNVATLANSEKKVWELLGLTSDPSLTYDVVATLTTALGGAGTVMLQGDYAE